MDALSAADYRRLLPALERVSLPRKWILFEPGGALRDVHFPLTGAFSLMSTMANGSTVAVTTIGNEGIVGMPAHLAGVASSVRVITHLPTETLRMAVRTFEREIGRAGSLHRLVQRYTQALFTQVSQAAGCNRLHSNEERLSRKLLMTQDRVRSDHFPMTHELLAQILGVRRASVTVIAGTLQDAGLIRYARGRVTVVDRRGLEAASCECYGVVKAAHDQLVPVRGTSLALSGHSGAGRR